MNKSLQEEFIIVTRSQSIILYTAGENLGLEVTVSIINYTSNETLTYMYLSIFTNWYFLRHFVKELIYMKPDLKSIIKYI